MAEHKFELFADYHQFYIQDEQAAGDLSNSWSEEAVDRLLAVAPGTIGVGTVRNMAVPVTVSVQNTGPLGCLDTWDHITECSIDVPSGRIVIAGCTDYFPDAARIEVEPGCYRARIFYGNLGSISDDGLEGNDCYRIVLWPAPASDLIVLKQWNGGK